MYLTHLIMRLITLHMQCTAHAHAMYNAVQPTYTVHMHMQSAYAHTLSPNARALTLSLKASSGSRCSRSSAHRCVTMAVTK